MEEDQKKIKNVNQAIDELSNAIDHIIGDIKPKYKRLAYEKLTILELYSILCNDESYQEYQMDLLSYIVTYVDLFQTLADMRKNFFEKDSDTLKPSEE